jgi:hypothetical protein
MKRNLGRFRGPRIATTDVSRGKITIRLYFMESFGIMQHGKQSLAKEFFEYRPHAPIPEQATARKSLVAKANALLMLDVERADLKRDRRLWADA